MTADVRRVAAAWLRRFVAKSEGSRDKLFEKFLGEKYEGGRARVPNPNSRTRDRYREVSVSTALKDPGFERKIREEFERWRGTKDETPPSRKEEPSRSVPRWEAQQDAILRLAIDGDVVEDHPVGDAGETANEVRKRRLRFGDHQADFVWKARAGEAPNNRVGIPQGSYHQREEASYNVDRLLGEGSVVPPTHSNGEGSYQEFANGARSLLDVMEPVMSADELASHPDFHRINVLDMITGHEDRHPGNVMFVRDATKPGGHRFVAIDNGFTLAEPADKIGVRAWHVKDPWTSLYEGDERADVKDALTRSTQSIDRDLHEQIQEVDHDKFVRALVRSGIKDRRALLAALVRLSAIQRDRKIVGSFSGEHHPFRFLGAQQEFQHMAAKEPEKLLTLAGDGPSIDDLRAVVSRALA